MKCSEIENQLDEYLDGTSHGGDQSDSQAAEIARHVQDCLECQAELERRQVLRDDLRSLPSVAASAGFFDRAVAQASIDAGSADPQRRRTDSPARKALPVGLLSLAASLLAALLVGTLYLKKPEIIAPETGLANIYLATDTVTPVKLAFSSETALIDARLTLSLPVGVELMGYDGRSDLSWNTDLEQGTNVLRLPLVGRMAASDFLVARLEHPSGAKTFRLLVTVNQSGAPQND